MATNSHRPFADTAISIADLYLAYRKAKVEAFYESTQIQALAFTEYEQHLEANLSRLHWTLLDPECSWWLDLSFIGGYAYVPKSIDFDVWEKDGDGHFRALDPLRDWARLYEKSGKKRAKASLRLIIKPTVDFQIVSALWIIKVGRKFDGALDSSHCFANRLRRQRRNSAAGQRNAYDINLATPALFEPYFSAYRQWRQKGLSSMDEALSDGRNILAITMDIERFYHRVSPKFLTRRGFLDALRVRVSRFDLSLTEALLSAIDTWYQSTPDYRVRPEGAIPVGLSASKIIANVLLAEFDKSITKRLRPIYYGRYVDDIFLVFENRDDLSGAKEVTKWLSSKLSPMLAVKRNANAPPSLKLKLTYARDSELIFAGKKQKIFSLSSAHGLDLVGHIREQIRIQSSEYRLLPEVPTTSVEMASKALLATPDAKIEVDALRKAEAVSVRRLGLSLLLRDIEVYSADLQPQPWRVIRDEFYGLVQRHVLTPVGVFEYWNYLPRIFGLMLACKDFNRAEEFVSGLTTVCRLLKRTTSLGQRRQSSAFLTCLQHFAEALKQAGLQAATERRLEINERFLGVLRALLKLDRSVKLPISALELRAQVHQVLLADLGRRPYKDYWYLDQKKDELGPPVPTQMRIRRILRLAGIRRFRKLSSSLRVPHWLALAFSTRPLRVDEISLVAPDVLLNPSLYRNTIMLLRGARVVSNSAVGFVPPMNGGPGAIFSVPGVSRPRVTLAITSYKTSVRQWAAAAKNQPDLSQRRYAALNFLVNRILNEGVRPDYIIFPELSLPRRWGLRVARKLAMNSVSLLAGVEYYCDRRTRLIRNDVLVSLTTKWPGYLSNIVRLQPKFAPSHEEKSALRKLGQKLVHPIGIFARPTLYVHKGFCFSILICSDLTNISHRNELRGQIDSLFVLEWNPDVKTFSSLVEATASDLHTFVAQVNNRAYGDSRVRAPAKIDYERDIIQVKGGESDFYVLGSFDYHALRKEQRSRSPRQFKPTPIGYKLSKLRKNGIP